jgi:hypothetical protein
LKSGPAGVQEEEKEDGGRRSRGGRKACESGAAELGNANATRNGSGLASPRVITSRNAWGGTGIYLGGVLDCAVGLV